MLISVIIPVYNAALYLEETLKSLTNQTYQNFEAIMIDDHSSDESWEIIQRICLRDERFSAYKNIKKGAACARNYAFSLSKGTYIQYLDADDILHPRKIETQLEHLKANQFDPEILIGCQWQFFSKQIENLFGPLGPQLRYTSLSSKEWLLTRPDMVPITWLFSRSQIEKAKGWNEELSRNDDGEFLYRVLAQVKEVHVVPQLLVYYRREETMSLSKNLSKESLISWIKSARTYKNVISEVIGDDGKTAADQFFFILYYFCLFKYPDLAIQCYKELYYPQRNYDTEDQFVNKIAKYIGVKYAKRFRMFTHQLRGIKYN